MLRICREEKGLEASDNELAVGQVRRLARLGSEAVYRIDSIDDELVWVEVVDAPGLRPGQRFRFTRTSVARMELEAVADRTAAQPSFRAVPPVPVHRHAT